MPIATIPPIVHLFWVPPDGASEHVPNEILESLESWEAMHPNVDCKLWLENDVLDALKDSHPQFMEAFKLCRLPAMRADLVRIALLYKYGGFWSDLRNKALAPFLSGLLPVSKPILVEHFQMPSRPDPSRYLCTSFMGSPRESELMKDFLANVIENVINRRKGGIFNLTGAGALMNFIEKKGLLDNDYLILHWHYFWDLCLKRTPGKYNATRGHWSVRQKNEALFL